MNYRIKRKLDKFFANYPVRRLERRQILIHNGDKIDNIFYIVRGQVRQYDITSSGEEIIVDIFKAGAFIPMMLAFNHSTSQYFFEASSDVIVRTAPVREVLNLIKNDPDIALDLLTRIMSGIEGMERRMAHLMGGTGRSRLIFELIIECRRFGLRLGLDGYKLDFHEDELAKRCGLTRETVNREIRKLKNDGLIVTSRKSLIVKHLNKLSEALGTEL